MATQIQAAPPRQEATDPDLARLRRDGGIALRFSPGLVDLLEGVAGRMDAPLTDVLTQAMTLLGLAVEAQEAGLRVCLADADLNVVREIVGFGIPEEDGPDEGPEAGPGTDRP